MLFVSLLSFGVHALHVVVGSELHAATTEIRDGTLRCFSASPAGWASRRWAPTYGPLRYGGEAKLVCGSPHFPFGATIVVHVHRYFV